jgi:hypothetical protein
MNVPPAASSQFPTSELSGESAVAKIMSPNPVLRVISELTIPMLEPIEVTTGYGYEPVLPDARSNSNGGSHESAAVAGTGDCFVRMCP